MWTSLGGVLLFSLPQLSVSEFSVLLTEALGNIVLGEKKQKKTREKVKKLYKNRCT